MRRPPRQPVMFNVCRYHEDMLDCCVALKEVRTRGITLEEFARIAACNTLHVRMVHAPDTFHTYGDAGATNANTRSGCTSTEPSSTRTLSDTNTTNKTNFLSTNTNATNSHCTNTNATNSPCTNTNTTNSPDTNTNTNKNRSESTIRNIATIPTGACAPAGIHNGAVDVYTFGDDMSQEEVAFRQLLAHCSRVEDPVLVCSYSRKAVGQTGMLRFESFVIFILFS